MAPPPFYLRQRVGSLPRKPWSSRPPFQVGGSLAAKLTMDASSTRPLAGV
jgi:hypothetical protein